MRPRDPKKAEAIRRKALELLVLEGFDAFSMQKLAKAAGVSPATLYIHFADREDLIFTLWQEQVAALGDRLLDGFDPEQPFEKELWRQWTQRIAFFRERPLAWQFIQQVMQSPLHEKYMKRQNLPIQQVTGGFLVRALERGEITDFGLGDRWRASFPRDTFWALAYAPLYSMLRWVPDASKPLEESPVHVDLDAIRTLFACVIKGLKP